MTKSPSGNRIPNKQPDPILDTDTIWDLPPNFTADLEHLLESGTVTIHTNCSTNPTSKVTTTSGTTITPTG